MANEERESSSCSASKRYYRFLGEQSNRRQEGRVKASSQREKILEQERVEWGLSSQAEKARTKTNSKKNKEDLRSDPGKSWHLVPVREEDLNWKRRAEGKRITNRLPEIEKREQKGLIGIWTNSKRGFRTTLG